MNTGRRLTIIYLLLGVAALLLAVGCLLVGSVHIPAEAVLAILTGHEVADPTWSVILLQSRLPMIATAALAGAALSVAGLLLQTTFNNPLAGPSILGVSTGASLGVAIVMLWGAGALAGNVGLRLASVMGAIAGASVVLVLLLIFSRILKSSTMLLIVGIMIGYFASSGISLLNFFSTQEGVHSFVIWGLGNFNGVTASDLPLFSLLVIAAIVASVIMSKPLNALLMGQRYAVNLGVNVNSARNLLLILSALLTALVTAYCGPIGFIGIIVPHIARMLLRTAHHSALIPATMLVGVIITLLCTFISVLPATIIPINAITPIVGAPVILYIIVYRHKLYYF